MKAALILTALALAGPFAVPAGASIFHPETVRGAVVGGVAGAIIGHNDGRHGREGAAYGALAGGLIGSAIANAREDRRLRPTMAAADSHRYGRWTAPRSRWHFGYSGHWGARPGHHHPFWGRSHVHRPGRHDPFWDRSHVYRPLYPNHYRTAPSWRWRTGWAPYHRPHYAPGITYRSRGHDVGYAGRGALLGGLLGAVIGHNDGRHGWEGAAYGAGAGYLLGSWADARERQAIAAREAAERAAALERAPARAEAPAQVTIINNYYSSGSGSPMSGANRLFGR